MVDVPTSQEFSSLISRIVLLEAQKEGVELTDSEKQAVSTILQLIARLTT